MKANQNYQEYNCQILREYSTRYSQRSNEIETRVWQYLLLSKSLKGPDMLRLVRTDRFPKLENTAIQCESFVRARPKIGLQWHRIRKKVHRLVIFSRQKRREGVINDKDNYLGFSISLSDGVLYWNFALKWNFIISYYGKNFHLCASLQ